MNTGAVYEWRGAKDPVKTPLEGGLILDLTVDPPHLVVGGSTTHPLLDQPLPRSRRAATRMLDLAVAVPLLILTTPLIVVLAVAVRHDVVWAGVLRLASNHQRWSILHDVEAADDVLGRRVDVGRSFRVGPDRVSRPTASG